MLQKEYRLTSKYEYGTTKRYGKTFQGRFFHLYYLTPRNYTGPAKAGIVVSNSFSKSAVKRNRLKRVFREVVRNGYNKLPKNLWVVVYPKYFSINSKYEEISSDFTCAIQKISVA